MKKFISICICIAFLQIFNPTCPLFSLPTNCEGESAKLLSKSRFTTPATRKSSRLAHLNKHLKANREQVRLFSANKPTVFILLGAPGSGKGTQAQLLSKKLNLPYVSVGNILRKKVTDNSAESKKIAPYIAKGQLVPTNLVLPIIFNQLDLPECQKGVILDGSSRNQELAAELCQHLQAHFDYVAILLDVPDEVVEKRLCSRKVCKQCHASYSVFSDSHLYCKNCHTELVKRDDDAPKIAASRIKNYRKEENAILDLFLKPGKLIIVNGDQDANMVSSQLVSFISRFYVQKIRGGG